MKELSIEEKAKRYDGNYKTYTELINRLECVKDAIKKQNYGIAMDILCKPYPEFQITASIELKESEESIIRDIRVVLESSATRIFKENGQMPVWYDRAVAWLEKQGGEQKPVDKVESKFKVGDYIKPIDKCLGSPRIIEEVYDGWYVTDQGTLDFEFEDNWELVEKPIWSEEDKRIIDNLISQLGNLFARKLIKEETKDKYVNWLKSLKERYTWKPSDEQMDGLNYVVNFLASSERPIENDLCYNILKSLRQQLKKLREE